MTTRAIVFNSALLFCFVLMFSQPSIAQTWVGNGPTYKSIKAITKSPTNANLLYAGAFGWGVFKSSDAGATWSSVKTGMTNTHTRSILALSDNTVFAGTNDGVFKTTNGGLSWTLSKATLYSVRSLAYDLKAIPPALYAGTFGSGIYKSTDQGTSWTQISVHDPNVNQTLAHIWSIVVYGKDSLYVGGSITDISQGGALFSTANGGGNWHQVENPNYPNPGVIKSSIHSIAISPNNPDSSLIVGTASLGVHKSTDGGLTLLNINGPTGGLQITDKHINAVGFNTAYRYAGTDSLGKFYYRALGDVSVGWNSGTGLPGAQAVVSSIDIDVTSRNRVYVGTEGLGTYHSLDSGKTWTSRNTGMLGTAGRAVRLNGNGNLIVGTDFGDGIWLSTNQGNTWTRADILTTSDAITAIGITNNNLIMYAGAYGAGVHKSTDGGHVWIITDSTVINHFVRALVVDPGNADVVYAGTGNGVYRTNTGGTFWSSLSSGIPSNTSIRSMDIDPTNANIIFAGSDSSYLYKTTNSGATWNQITNANGFLPQDKFIRSINIDHVVPNIVYVGSDSGRIYKTTDGGANWSLLFKLPGVHSVRSILIDPNLRTILFAATFGDGIFLSTDSGTHWSPFNTALPDSEFYTLESDNANPIHLYAGSGNNGVFHTTYAFVNRSPVLATIGNKSVLSGHQLSFTVTATDSDGTFPTLTAAGLPSGATLHDSANGHAGFLWTPTNPQIGSYNVTFIASDGSLSDSEIVVITVLDSGSAVVINRQVEQGWNMVSLPVVVTDPRKVTLYPTATSSAFVYSSGYVPRDSMIIGDGYWLKFGSDQIVSLGGGSVTIDTANVLAGWNIVGSLSTPIPIGNVTPIPPVTIVSNFFGYSSVGGYSIADSLKPGRAYWLKVNQNGKLVLH